VTETPQPQRPGAWPVTQPVHTDAANQTDHDELYVQRAQERALHEMVLGSIEHDLRQQPSPTAIRNAAVRWKNAITNLAEDLINTRRNER
jgi:hypothetical protein